MSDINPKEFPAFSGKAWESMKSKSREYLEERHKEEMEMIEEKVKGLTLSENADMKDADTDIRVVLIGKTGTGKSATANTIFGKDKFIVSGRSQSETQVSRRVTGAVNGRRVSVVDTPGLADTGRGDKYIKKEIARYAEFLPDGVHAFIYVMNMASVRYTDEDQKVFQHLKAMFGNSFEKYCILLFTHGDRPLDEYCKTEKQAKSPMGKFLKLLDWRVAAIDNAAPSALEKQMHRDYLLKIITKVATEVNPPIYTNKAFEKAQSEFEKYHAKALRENWDPEMMDLVEDIIGLNPDIPRKDLEEEVKNKYAERIKEKKRIAAEETRKLQEENDREEREREREREEDRKRMEEEFKAREEVMKRQLEQRLEDENKRREEEARRQTEKLRKEQQERQEQDRLRWENQEKEQKKKRDDNIRQEKRRAEQNKRRQEEEEERLRENEKKLREESEARYAKLRLQAEEERERLEAERQRIREKQEREAEEARKEREAEKRRQQRERQEIIERERERESEVERQTEAIAEARKGIFGKVWGWVKNVFN